MPAASSSECPAPQATFRERFLAHGRFKILTSILIGLWFGFCYLTLQRFPVRPPTSLPLTFIDRSIPFSPHWIWVYEGLLLIINLPLWLCDRLELLRRHVASVVLSSVVCFAVYIVFPVAAPRPDSLPQTHSDSLYSAIIRIDTPLNSFPSLHAVFITLSVLLAWRGCRHGVSTFARACFGGFCLLVLYSTVATRQHYAADLPAGVAVALLSDLVIRRVDRGEGPCHFARAASNRMAMAKYGSRSHGGLR